MNVALSKRRPSLLRTETGLGLWAQNHERYLLPQLQFGMISGDLLGEQIRPLEDQ